MKKIFLLPIFVMMTCIISAQSVAINNNGAVADNSAMLDVSSTTKGILAPRMTTAQRTAIASPANGLFVFDTDTKTFWYFSTSWKEISLSGGGSFSLPFTGSFSDPDKIFSITNTDISSGIGIKGVSSTLENYSDRGAVTGINSSTGIGVYGQSLGGGTGVKGVTNSLGYFGVQGVNNNGGRAIDGVSNGLNAIGIEATANPTNGTAGIGIEGRANTKGDGVKGWGAGSGNGVSGTAGFNSSGNGVYGETNQGTGNAIKGVSSNSNSAILGVNSIGTGVTGTSNGSGYGVWGTAGSSGAGIYGRSNPISSTGRAALFEIQSSQNTYDAVVVNNAGLAGTLNLKSSNSNNGVTMVRITKSGTGDFMVLENGAGSNLIRFSNGGKGYFNGGTQTGGADIAEAFDVDGNSNDYEPGDVLIISTDKDRSVLRSNQPYSSLVVGVYATKPGVLMTEENIETDLSDKVPMGVVGVIPTKVCLEGGEIKRGDMLVTSSISGVAMKADVDKVKPGQVIGKALENYSGNGIGKIKVLVNVK